MSARSTPKPVRRLHSSQDLARWGRVTVRAINKNPGLKPARVGSLYDLNHEAVQTWLAGRGFDIDDVEDVAVQAPRPSKVVEAELSPAGADVSLDSLPNMRLREITETIGSPHETLVWVKVRKELAAAKRQDYLMARVRGQLVPVELLANLFTYLDTLSTRLARDAAATIATSALSLAKSGGTREQVVSVARDAMLDQVNITKGAMRRAVANIDNAAPLRDLPPTRRESAAASGGRRALKHVETLLDQAAPNVVDLVIKHHTRDAQSAEQIASTVSTMLRAHVNKARLAVNAEERAAVETPKESNELT